MSPDVEYEEYEAPKQPPFFSFEREDSWYDIKFLKQLPDSEKFKLGDKPAKVWLIENQNEEFRLTLTSARLNDAIEHAKSAIGNIVGFDGLQIKAIGKEKDRTFRTRWPKSAQSKLGA